MAAVLLGERGVNITAIVGIAWYRAWRVLNLLGFAFTFGIGAAFWGLVAAHMPDWAARRARLRALQGRLAL